MSESKPDRFDEPEYEEPTESAAEPVTEAAPTPEPAEVVEEEVKPVPTVPLAALNEERHKQRELRAQLAELNQRLAGTEQLKAQLDEWRKQQQATTQTTEFQKDPLGALHEEIRSLKSIQENATNEQKQQAAQREQMEQFQRTVVSQVQEFQKTAPDYPDALSHLVEVRKAELRVMGVPEAQLEALVDQESVGLAQTALQRGMNPGQLVYDLAKARGFAGKPTAKPAGKPTLETIEKGQKASQTLSDGGGDTSLSLTDIAKMTDEEFDKDWERFAASQKKNSPRH